MIAGLLAVALAGDLRIEDLTPCSGDEIPAGSKVTVHYTGQVQGGEVFDSSYDRGKPLKVPLGTGMLIEGWDIGMQGMSVGCRRRLEIPPELAYGEKKVSPKIPPGSTLVFEIELLGIELAGGPEPAARVVPDAPRPVQQYETTDAGVKVADLAIGTGAPVQIGKSVTMEYTLWLVDGTLVDSSFKREGPFSYRVGRGMVIPGWEDGVAGMREGGVRQLVVPWKLAYGRAGRPPRIPKKADLVFEIELLSVR
ncbi:MAG: FKBP-type peptidyl-prolyl cis-trans isomerase [Myxococcota bacterium]